MNCLFLEVTMHPCLQTGLVIPASMQTRICVSFPFVSLLYQPIKFTNISQDSAPSNQSMLFLQLSLAYLQENSQQDLTLPFPCLRIIQQETVLPTLLYLDQQETRYYSNDTGLPQCWITNHRGCPICILKLARLILAQRFVFNSLCYLWRSGRRRRIIFFRHIDDDKLITLSFL